MKRGPSLYRAAMDGHTLVMTPTADGGLANAKPIRADFRAFYLGTGLTVAATTEIIANPTAMQCARFGGGPKVADVSAVEKGTSAAARWALMERTAAEFNRGIWSGGGDRTGMSNDARRVLAIWNRAAPTTSADDVATRQKWVIEFAPLLAAILDKPARMDKHVAGFATAAKLISAEAAAAITDPDAELAAAFGKK